MKNSTFVPLVLGGLLGALGGFLGGKLILPPCPDCYNCHVNCLSKPVIDSLQMLSASYDEIDSALAHFEGEDTTGRLASCDEVFPMIQIYESMGDHRKRISEKKKEVWDSPYEQFDAQNMMAHLNRLKKIAPLEEWKLRMYYALKKVELDSDPTDSVFRRAVVVIPALRDRTEPEVFNDNCELSFEFGSLCPPYCKPPACSPDEAKGAVVAKDVYNSPGMIHHPKFPCLSSEVKCD